MNALFVCFSTEIDQKYQEIMKRSGILNIDSKVSDYSCDNCVVKCYTRLRHVLAAIYCAVLVHFHLYTKNYLCAYLSKFTENTDAHQ